MKMKTYNTSWSLKPSTDSTMSIGTASLLKQKTLSRHCLSSIHVNVSPLGMPWSMSGLMLALKGSLDILLLGLRVWFEIVSTRENFKAQWRRWVETNQLLYPWNNWCTQYFEWCIPKRSWQLIRSGEPLLAAGWLVNWIASRMKHPQWWKTTYSAKRLKFTQEGQKEDQSFEFVEAWAQKG